MDPYSERLLTVSVDVVPAWIGRLIDRVSMSQTIVVDDDRRRAIVAEAASSLRLELTRLLSLDAAEQTVNPLTVFRRATTVVTDHLLALGAVAVERDEFHRRSFPDDVLDLCPATWADIDERLAEPGLEWGAWKAATLIARRRTD